MGKTPQQWYDDARAAIDTAGFRDSDVTEWDVFPWEKDWSVKPLRAPEEERPRRGLGGVDCHSCDNGRTLTTACWADDLFYVTIADDSSLPFAAFLMPRRHADLADLTPGESARQGELLTLIEQAAIATTSVPRIQVARWGDGGEHLHWWLYGRPAGMNQLRGSFLMMWDDVLPLRRAEEVKADGVEFATELARVAGGQVVGQAS